jgi:hypothetical protein
MVKRDVRVGELTHELNVLRADALCNKEADKACTFEAETRASRYDCDQLREEVKEWEEQAQEQQQGD